MASRSTDEGMPVWFNIYDPLVDPLVLAGSCLSGLMTFLVLLTFVVYHQEQRTFRHALVLNLTVAEFINSVNGAISGTYFVVTRELTPGALCSINGWLGQVSIQASDFSMFAIAVITLLTITEKVYMPAISRTKKILICLSIWIIPLATGSIAVGLGVMMPSGANWCWISASRTDLRYALTHAWRFAVILAIVCIYGYVYYHTSRRFKTLSLLASRQSSSTHYSNNNTNSMAMHSRHGSLQKPLPYDMVVVHELRAKHVDDVPHEDLEPPRGAYHHHHHHHQQPRDMRGRSWLRLSGTPEPPLPPPHPTLARKGTTAFTAAASPHDRPATAATTTTTTTPSVGGGWYHQSGTTTPTTRPVTATTTTTTARGGGEAQQQQQQHQGGPLARDDKRVEKEVKRMLLMNAYPILYVLLWIPGLVNRLLQAAGATPSSRVLDALQAAPVFIGFANSVTYGFNQHLRRRIASDFYYWWARRGWSRMKS